MKSIFCISGFGADHRVFSRLDLGTHQVHYLDWLIPIPQEPIGQYAQRMSAAIKTENPVILGLSFGGMMAIEIAKLISAEKIILISSIKTRQELPGWMKWAGKLRLDEFLPLKSFPLIEPLENRNLGIETEEERQMVSAYRKKVDPRYTSWAVHEILHWKNTWIPENLVHIHGGKDHIFPIRKIRADFVIEDGGHFMIMNRAEKINPILSKILDEPAGMAAQGSWSK